MNILLYKVAFCPLYYFLRSPTDIGKYHSFQLIWTVEEVIHVGHMISIRKMSKRLSNQPTTRLIMHSGTARFMLSLDQIN